MAYKVKLRSVGKHQNGIILFGDKKEKINMTITGEWKTIAKKTEKLKKWIDGGLIIVETIGTKKDESENEKVKKPKKTSKKKKVK